jgi:hypothetical protein
MFNIEQKPKPRKKEKLKEEDVSEDNPELNDFLKNRKQQNDRYKDTFETNYWCCLVFGSWDQKQEFLKQLKGVQTVYGGMYVDGQSFAESVGIEITPDEQKPYQSHIQKRLAEQVLQKERRRASGGLFNS